MTESRRPSTGGFREFLTKTNALALAIGVIIGVALGAVVNSLVNDIIMPPIGVALGGVDFAQIRTRDRRRRATGEPGLHQLGPVHQLRHHVPDRRLVVYVIATMLIKEAEPGPDQGVPVLLRGEPRWRHEVQGLRQRDLTRGSQATRRSGHLK